MAKSLMGKQQNSIKENNWSLKFNRLQAKYTLVDLFDYDGILKRKQKYEIFICVLVTACLFISFQESELYYNIHYYNYERSWLSTVVSLRITNLVISISICNPEFRSTYNILYKTIIKTHPSYRKYFI